MPIAKIIEISAQSEKSWEEAARLAVAEVSKTVRNIRQVWIKDLEAVVENNEIKVFRLIAKITFVVDRQ